MIICIIVLFAFFLDSILIHEIILGKNRSLIFWILTEHQDDSSHQERVYCVYQEQHQELVD